MARASRLLDGQSSGDAHATPIEGISEKLTSLAQKMEAVSFETAPDVEELRKVRNLLLEAARSLASEAEKFLELRLLALTDDLTGLYNRRGFILLAMQQLKLSRRNNQPVLVFFVDVDDLKRTNDLYGHDEGDRLLLRCAAALNNTFRDSDIVARLGGDEFLVLAPEGADRSFQAIVQRLNKAIDLVNAETGTTPLSLSVGMARFDPESPVTLSELLTAADCNMYQQKRSRAGAAGTDASGRMD